MTGFVLAHQGGWDEILFVLVPVTIFAGLLALANRRAIRGMASAADEANRADADAGGGGGGGGGDVGRSTTTGDDASDDAV